MDAVSIFPIATEEYKSHEGRAQEFRQMIEPEGAEWWTYVCCRPNEAQPNFLLDQTPYHNRAIMWRVWKDRETGFLYWAVNNYVIKDNRLTFDPIGTWYAYGDGALVFPGHLFGLDEPVASVRLERWKEGQEDYELLHMVEQKLGRETAEHTLAQVYRNPSDFTKDATQVEAFRLQLLHLLETNRVEK